MKDKRKQNNNWKPHKHRIALITTLGCLVTTGIGVGVGYAIWHSKNSNPDPIPPDPVVVHTYTLERTAKVLDWNRDPTESLYTEFTMKVDGIAIDNPTNVMLSIDTGSDYVTIDQPTNRITYTGKDVGGVKTPVYNTLPIDVTATYDGHTASTYIVLDDFEPTNVLEPNDPAWENLFKTSSGVLDSTDIVNSETNNWLQEQNQYNTIDLSSFLSIGTNAFSGCPSLTTGGKDITISFENFNATVATSISDYAFLNCERVKDIILPKETTGINVFDIDDYAFSGCIDLQNVSLPTDSSTANISIGVSAFENCTNLKNFDLPKGNVSIGVAGFRNCTKLETLSLPIISTNSVIASIGDGAFDGCANLSVEGIQALGNDGGSNPHIDTNNLVYVGNGTGTSIVGAAIVAAVGKPWIYGAGLISGNLANKLSGHFTSENPISFDGFYNCASLTDIDLRDAIASDSSSGLFYYCVNLENVFLPTNLVSIGPSAFQRCTKLTTLSWYHAGNPSSIGNSAFFGCDSLATIYYASGGSPWYPEIANAPSCNYFQI
ncbi:MAG: leucine-rich repeat domain-containing protein [Mycoplasmataceae bacterium]|nr:leucine-rich repeat domain-containing protein [Mycoplasmataceae bacterium]